MLPSWVSECGTVKLYNGDCDSYASGGSADLLLTDPPYGIGIASNPVRQMHKKKDWDASCPSDALIERFVRESIWAVVWGGNYFSLGKSQCFFVWDKLQPQEFSLAMAEFAWTNKRGPAKLFRKSVTSYRKSHPTQKPVELMTWCIRFFPEATTVIDPFMGSGTTGVACIQTGRSFIGIEKDKEYFEIAKNRIAEELQRTKLIEHAIPRQSEMFEGAGK